MEGTRTNCARRKVTRSGEGIREISSEICEMGLGDSHRGAIIDSTSHVRLADLRRC